MRNCWSGEGNPVVFSFVSSDLISSSRDSIASIISIGSIDPFSSESIDFMNSYTSPGGAFFPSNFLIPACNSGPSIFPSSLVSICSKTSLIVKPAARMACPNSSRRDGSGRSEGESVISSLVSSTSVSSSSSSTISSSMSSITSSISMSSMSLMSSSSSSGASMESGSSSESCSSESSTTSEASSTESSSSSESDFTTSAEVTDFVGLFVSPKVFDNSSRSITPLPSSSIAATRRSIWDGGKSANRKDRRPFLNSSEVISPSPSSSNFANRSFVSRPVAVNQSPNTSITLSATNVTPHDGQDLESNGMRDLHAPHSPNDSSETPAKEIPHSGQFSLVIGTTERHAPH